MNLPLITNDLPNADYHFGSDYKDFWSSSQLKNYLISPKYAKFQFDNPEEKSTPAMELGTLYHACMESFINTKDKDSFFDSVAIFDPPINQRTGEAYGQASKAFADAKENFEIENYDKTIASKENLEIVRNMFSSLMESKEIRYMCKIGTAEQSHFLEYEGCKYKYRTDGKTAKKIFDWKKTTLENPKPENFAKEIIKYGYHISAAMYQFFEHELTGIWKPFFWIVQESEPPYDFLIHDSRNWTWEIYKEDGMQIVEPRIGALQFMKILEQHRFCVEHNSWPGYSSFIEPDWQKKRIAAPEVPGWYEKNIFNYFN